MSYMEQTCPHSGAFGYRAPKKGRNLSWFVELALGALVLFGIFAGIVMIGGCLGCEVCFECAAACDEEMGCGLEECARDCNAQSDDCVSCEGVDCFGREGCFACDGKWDCSECSGEVYYKVELISGEVTTPLKFKGGTNRVTVPAYNDDRPQNYFTFKGYYNKKIGGDKYIDESGNVVKKITKDIKLYAQYDEVNAYETYVIEFSTINQETGDVYFPAPEDVNVKVGVPFDNLPEYEKLDDFEFKGWYTLPNGQGKLAIAPDETDFTFHLSDFNIDPNGDKRVIVYAYYSPKLYTITFNYVNGNVESKKVESGSLFGEVADQMGSSGSNYKFFGWSNQRNEQEITNVISNDERITNDINVYEVAKRIYKLKFEYGEGQTYEYLAYDGEYVNFGNIQQLKEIEEDISLKKGYEFKYWMEKGKTYETTGIEVSATSKKEFVAKYEPDPYSISYYAIRNGVERNFDFAVSDSLKSYTYGEPFTLWVFSDPNYGTFVGWHTNPYASPEEAFTSLTAEDYGDKKLYAIFR